MEEAAAEDSDEKDEIRDTHLSTPLIQVVAIGLRDILLTGAISVIGPRPRNTLLTADKFTGVLAHPSPLLNAGNFSNAVIYNIYFDFVFM